ncbi:MAG: hypothetical protein IPK16_05225 [Anaerolineales bacterium]|nr:hypothetical protein [Anaerolineales bacterium]
MKLLRSAVLFVVVLMVAACSPTSSSSTQQPPTPTPVAFQPTLGRALSFLARRYDPGVGLLRENVTSTTHWLAPDNLLARQVFAVANADELDAKVGTALTERAATQNGLLETLAGVTVSWPPHTLVESEVAPGVKEAAYTGEGVIEEWRQSSDLLFYGALNAWNGAITNRRMNSTTLRWRRLMGWASRTKPLTDSMRRTPLRCHLHRECHR